MAGEQGDGKDRKQKRARELSWTVQFEGQMLVCALLAKALYASPDRDWIDHILSAGLFKDLPYGSDTVDSQSGQAMLSGWAALQDRPISDAQFDALEADYTQLFVGPGRLPAAPWESVYSNSERAVFQIESASVKNWYRRFDLVLDSDYNQPADHVGVEFGFMAHLGQATLQAAELGDGALVKTLLAAQRGFLSQHMTSWISRWSADVIEHGRTEFFRGIAVLARGTLEEAQSFFSLPSVQSSNTGPFRIA